MPNFEIRLSNGDVLPVEIEEADIVDLLNGSGPQRVEASDGVAWVNPAQIVVVRQVRELDPSAYRIRPA